MTQLAKKKFSSVMALMLTAITVPAIGAQTADDSQKPGALRIESTQTGATVFVRTGGHNGFAEVGKTPTVLKDLEPGLLEHTSQARQATGRQVALD